VSSYYHLGFVVDDLDQAVADATRALSVAFSPVPNGRLGDWDYRITFSTQGPPYFELIQGPGGQPVGRHERSPTGLSGLLGRRHHRGQSSPGGTGCAGGFRRLPLRSPVHLSPTVQPRGAHRTGRHVRAASFPRHLVPGAAAGALDVGAAATELVAVAGFAAVGVPGVPEQPASVRPAATTAAPIHAARCRSDIDFVPFCNGFVWHMTPTMIDTDRTVNDGCDRSSAFLVSRVVSLLLVG